LGSFAYWSQSQIITESGLATTHAQVDMIAKQISSMQNAYSLISARLDSDNVALTNLIAELISHDPSILEHSAMVSLAKQLGVDEIFVTDDKGVIRWGTVPEFVGFDFATTDQTKPFLKALNDKSFSLAQTPTPRGSDKKLWQYIGVARQDKPGIVQIGIEPKTRSALLDSVTPQKLVADADIGERGSAFMLSTNGTTIAHSNQSLVGNDVKQYDWGQTILREKNGQTPYIFNGEEKYMAFAQVGENYVGVSIPASELKAPLKKLLANIVMAILASIVISGIIIHLVIRRIVTKPLDRFGVLLGQAAQGDLRERMLVQGQDEIAELSRHFNSMTEKLTETIRTLNTASDRIGQVAQTIDGAASQSASSAEQVAATMEELASSASHNAEQSQNGAEVLNQLAQAIEQVTKSSQVAAESSETALEAIQTGNRAMDQQQEKMTDSANSAQSVAAAIAGIAEQSKQVVAIVDVISDIANQTNLLALNAAIEAARAGEAGRGFTVVAEEVRKLAERSNQEARKITDLVQGIESAIDHGLQEMGRAKTIVEAQTQAAGETSQAFVQIRKAVETIAEQIQEEAAIAEEMSASADEVVRAVQSISAGSQQAAAGVEEVAATSQEQANTAKQLQEIARQLREGAGSLAAQVAQFKI
ncbi:MAG: methyl-accepting chemotaxis protein, partial [Bacillota bacterium]